MAIVETGPRLQGLQGIGGKLMPTIALTLIGSQQLQRVFREAPKAVAAAALRISVMRGTPIVRDEIFRAASNIPSRWSMGTYSRSLRHRVYTQSRHVHIGIVGNLIKYSEGPFQQDIEMNRSARRKPAKYWHFVEWGSYNVRTRRRNRAHHLISRAVTRVYPRLRRTLEAACLEVAARHYRLPPLMMNHLITTNGPLPRVP